MKFLNGFKTAIGLLGMVATVVLPKAVPVINEAAPHAVAVAQGVFGLLTALGIIHKVEKAKAAAGN